MRSHFDANKSAEVTVPAGNAGQAIFECPEPAPSAIIKSCIHPIGRLGRPIRTTQAFIWRVEGSGAGEGLRLALLRGGFDAVVLQRGDVGHARTEQGNLERSASAPRVHKRCQWKNWKLCMRAMK
eukprot:3454798-Pleurochrysis_carterae.AAC.7